MFITKRIYCSDIKLVRIDGSVELLQHATCYRRALPDTRATCILGIPRQRLYIISNFATFRKHL